MPKPPTVPDSLSRRQVLQWSATLGSAAALASCASITGSRAPHFVRGRLRHACIGVGGMGQSDHGQLMSHPEVDIVALCDVDAGFLAAAKERSPAARTYTDWRELLEREAEHIDSVNVTTPDHMHAPITLAALARGKHVYCQKPLTRTVAEARAVASAARRSGCVTQMGIQNHSNAPYTSALAAFKERHIGDIHEVHVWSDRPKNWWPQGMERVEGDDPVPEGLDWSGWLGGAPARPFKAGSYHPFVWRGVRDFGTGAQGDMGCHLIDPALWFLGLGDALTVRSDGPRPTAEAYPLWSRVHYTFAGNALTTRGPVQLTWYDGEVTAPKPLTDTFGFDGTKHTNACLFVGTEGAFLASPYADAELLPAEKFQGVTLPKLEGTNHWHNFVDACRGEATPAAPFEYAAELTEVALLGNISLSFPHETLRWNAARMRFEGRPEANELLG